MIARVKDTWLRVFAAETTVTSSVVYRVLLALWWIGFWLPRLPYAWELYCRPVLRHVHKVVKYLDHPVPPLWLVEAAIVLAVALFIGFMVTRRPRLFHLLSFAPLCFLLAFDTMMPRAYGALAFTQWCILLMVPYDQLRDDDGTIRRGPNTGVRLLQIEWASVYVFTVPAKLWGGRGWLDGSVLWRTFHGTRYGDWMFSHWFDIPLWACAVACYVTMFLELFVGIGIWFQKTRRLAMIACVLLHTGMTVSLRVSLLFPTLMILHLVLFVTDEEWNRLFAWWKRGPWATIRGRPE